VVTEPKQVKINSEQCLYRGHWNSFIEKPEGHGVAIRSNGDIFEGHFYGNESKDKGRYINA
jgi:hypothetical protein